MNLIDYTCRISVVNIVGLVVCLSASGIDIDNDTYMYLHTSFVFLLMIIAVESNVTGPYIWVSSSSSCGTTWGRFNIRYE